MKLRRLKKQLKQEQRQIAKNRPRRWLWLLLLLLLTAAALPLYRQWQKTAPQRLFAAAAKYEILGEIATAQKLYKQLYEGYPQSQPAAEALLRTGQIHQYDQRQYQEALLSFLQLEHDYPEHPLVRKAQREAAQIAKDSLRDYPRAIVFYQRLLEHPGGDRDRYRYEIADCYFRLDNYSQARIELDILLEENPQTPMLAEVLYRKANLLLLENRSVAARETWQRLIDEFPGSSYSVEARFNLAKLLEEEDRLQAALKLYQQLENYPQQDLLQEKIEHLKRRIAAKKKAI